MNVPALPSLFFNLTEMDRGESTEKKSIRITFRITPSEDMKLALVCQNKEKNVSELIRNALKSTYKI